MLITIHNLHCTPMIAWLNTRYTKINSPKSKSLEHSNNIGLYQYESLHRESKKTRHQTLGHNFTNYYPIFKIFSLADSVVNLQQIHV